ncbi:uncharacterized protein HMPREF1541_03898 [Cyphellophora europaea CBS 101466]|uniref:Spindle pole body component n=1 Tax=Cyphellophora europaea (strain CBS 101466) TaxID=1220924 RepID=W2S1Y4_CYPE1|nr:uncharacterized protein HMPREF1541_03898 [Cyphellophora europaea CBS 101466]ETN41959.1 hypothetical protein HMPREF1541_03898 [Cyphellophora europaea CBS 101466]
MLHEILLSLSGYQSEIFEKVKNTEHHVEGIHNFTSEPERAMLETLAHIAQLHIDIKQIAARIASDHSSVVCRGVASAILDVHLAAFRKKIIQVEHSILRQDSSYVGGYGIVPLSTVVSDFAPWTRPLEWLLKVTRVAGRQSEQESAKGYCTGNEMLDFLHSETHTGYADVEELAVSLLITAQKMWMRSVASWILYGRLPTLGTGDFFIQQNPNRTSVVDDYILDRTLVPRFVSRSSAESMLAIGNALCQLQVQNRGTRGSQTMALLPKHLRILETLEYPLNQSILQLAVEEIDCSISQNVLSEIVPLHQILGVLDVVHRFMLLSNGEFATALIEHAGDKIRLRQTAPAVKPARKVGRIDDLTITDAELNSILTKSWDELAALQTGQAVDDETFNLARGMLALHGIQEGERHFIPLATLMPNATVLDLKLAVDSTLKLFLSPADLRSYAAINAYLLSIRRTELHLSHLWKLTPQRRCYPTPFGPPISASPYGQSALASRRTREQARSTAMRRHWATASKALFVVNELDAYLHGEVIRNSWDHFQGWLQEGSRPSSSRSGSRPGTASSAKTASTGLSRSKQMNDPRTLAKGHHTFLSALYSGLLLNNAEFVKALRELLNSVDHYIALFSRLSSIWSGLDLQEDEGVVDAFSNYKEEERTVLAETTRSRIIIEEGVGVLVERLKDAERKRDAEGPIGAMDGLDLHAASVFIPWKGRNMERLIMKLDYLAGAHAQDVQEKLVDDIIDD